MWKPLRWPLMLALILSLALVVTGCSDDDDDNPADPGGTSAPEYEGGTSVTVPPGLQNATAPEAQMVNGFIMELNTLSNFGAIFTPPAKAQKDDGPPWTWTWTYSEGNDTITVTMVVDETDDTYTWTMRWDGTIDGETFDDVLVYSAEQAKDDSWGNFRLYDLEYGSGDVVMEWDWTTNALGTVTFTLTMWDGDDSERLVAVINLDGSGSLDVEELVGTVWQTVWHFEWTALGGGTWASYEGGVLVDSGSWPAGIGTGK